jgi:hypothetical protein
MKKSKPINVRRLLPALKAVLLCCSLLAVAGCRGGVRGAGDLDRIPVQSDLKITKAVLYQNGVGYFERRGVVNSNVLHLRIRHDQVMDVLKSLTVVDMRKGRAVTISLPAERSRLMQLSQLPPQVRTSGGMLAIASAFRGATAVITTEGDTFRGRIVGVENIGTHKKPDWRLTLLRRKGAISSHAIRDIRSMKVLDKTLTLGLSKSLDVALNKGKWKGILGGGQPFRRRLAPGPVEPDRRHPACLQVRPVHPQGRDAAGSDTPAHADGRSAAPGHRRHCEARRKGRGAQQTTPAACHPRPGRREEPGPTQLPPVQAVH